MLWVTFTMIVGLSEFWFEFAQLFLFKKLVALPLWLPVIPNQKLANVL